MTSSLKDAASAVKAREEIMPECAALLWEQLKSERFAPMKFMRQVIFSEYVVDFASLEKKVVVECNRSQELFSKKDARRDAWFRKEGYAVLKFWDNEIFIDMQGVLENIYDACQPSAFAPEE